MKTGYRILSLFLTLLMLAFLPLQLAADGGEDETSGAFDASRTSTLRIVYQNGKTLIPNASFSLYFVASYDRLGNLTPTAKFEEYEPDLDQTTSGGWNRLAGTLAGYVAEDEIKADATLKTDEKGEASKTRLRAGLYLLIASKTVAGDYSYTAEPALVILPGRDEKTGARLYDVTVYPKSKAEEITEPTPETTKRTVLKKWVGREKPEEYPKEVTVTLMKDGKKYTATGVSNPVKLNAENDWKYTWDKLPLKDKDGTKIEWTVTETKVDGYTTTYTEKGVDILVTNTYDEPPVTSHTVEKKWSDAGHESARPEKITVTLMQNGAKYTASGVTNPVTLTKSGDWKYTWNNLPVKDDKDKTIVWTVEESAVSGYTASGKTEGTKTTITNTYKPPENEYTKRDVEKKWNDGGNTSRRPAQVTVKLLKNGTEYRSAVLSKANNWHTSWEDLPKYDEKGAEIKWTVKEVAVANYTSTVKQDGNTFIVTNTPDELPATGLLWWPVPVLICVGMVFLTVGIIRRRSDES